TGSIDNHPSFRKPSPKLDTRIRYFRHARVREHLCPKLARRKYIREHKSLGKLDLRVVIKRRPDQTFRIQPRPPLESLSARQHSMSRQRLPPRKQIVKNHPGPNRKPPASALFKNRDRHRQRPHEIRSDPQQSLTLAQRLIHKSKLEMFEIAQAAVNEPRGRARRPGTDLALLDQQHFQPAHRSVASDPRAV